MFMQMKLSNFWIIILYHCNFRSQIDFITLLQFLLCHLKLGLLIPTQTRAT
jgi:hypothetical protein